VTQPALWLCAAAWTLLGCSTAQNVDVYPFSFKQGVPMAHVVFTREHNSAGQAVAYAVYDAGDNLDYDTLVSPPGALGRWHTATLTISRAETFRAKVSGFSYSLKNALNSKILRVSDSAIPDYDCIVLGKKGESTATVIEAIKTMSPSALEKDKRFSFVAWPGTPERERSLEDLLESAEPAYQQPPIAWLRFSWNCTRMATVGTGKTVEWDRPAGNMKLVVVFGYDSLPITTAQLEAGKSYHVIYQQRGLNSVKGVSAKVISQP